MLNKVMVKFSKKAVIVIVIVIEILYSYFFNYLFLFSFLINLFQNFLLARRVRGCLLNFF